MSQDDEGLFKSMMGDVKPIKVEKRVPIKKSDDESRETLRQRREAAQQETLEDNNELSGEFIEPVDPLDDLAFQRPGVQHGVYKKLRLGKYSVEARLDLHRHTVEQARIALDQFIKDCIANDIRCALVTHGKGQDRRPQPALLKSCVAHWLPQLKDVMAFHSAQKHHGGVGATYVMLRKSEKKRMDNLEKHQKRRN